MTPDEPVKDAASESAAGRPRAAWPAFLRRHFPLLLLAVLAWHQRGEILRDHPTPKYWPDTPTYYPNARFFLGMPPAGGELSGHDRNMMIMRSPVYSALMALTAEKQGLDRMNSFDWTGLYHLQLRLGIATALLFYGIGFVFSGSRVTGVLCGLAYTAAWQNVNFETILLSESASFFFGALAVFMFALACRHGSLVLWTAAGAGAALACMTRPTLTLLFLLFLPGPWLAARTAWRGRVKQTAALVAGFLLLTQPWALRNKLLGDYWGVTNAGPCNMSGLFASQFKYTLNPTEDEWLLIRFFEAANKRFNGYYGRAWAPGPGVLLQRGWTVGRYTRTLRSLCIKTFLQPEVFGHFMRQAPYRYIDAWHGLGTEGVLERHDQLRSRHAALYGWSDALFMREGKRGRHLMPWLLLAGLLASVLAARERWRHPVILVLTFFPFLTAAAVLIDPVELERHFSTCQPLLFLGLVLMTADSFTRVYINWKQGRGIVGSEGTPDRADAPLKT